MARQKTGRMCTAEEVAHLCVYLASDEVSVCAAACVNIHSGQTFPRGFPSIVVGLRHRDGAHHRWRLETLNWTALKPGALRRVRKAS